MSEIQSLARGLQILDLIANTPESMGVTELAAALNIDKSSASRLVKTLVNYGYLQQETRSRRYGLGARFYDVGWQLVNRMPIREKAQVHLLRLMQQSGECAHTAIYSEGKALIVDDVEGEASLRVVGGIGRRIPLHCTAVGKSLLAFGQHPLPAVLEARTAKSITDPVELDEHLGYIRRLGYAFDDEENDLGVRCLAAPVYGVTGNMIATIGISGPSVRISSERMAALAALVMQAAEQLSAELGYVPNGNKPHHKSHRG